MRRSARRFVLSVICAGLSMQWTMGRAMAESAADAAVAKLDTDCAGGVAALMSLANAEDPKASLFMGLLYSKQLRSAVPLPPTCLKFGPDTSKEIYLLSKAASAGVADAAYALVAVYGANIDIPRDTTQARKWFFKAAALGNTKAQHQLMDSYATGASALPTDDSTVGWILKLADSGDPRALTIKGMMIEQGVNLPKNLQLALQFYEAAAKLSDPEGAFLAGTMLFNGTGVPNDSTAADKYFLQAAQAGLAVAQNQIANSYRLGFGIPIDLQQAFYWYQKAGSQGITYAKAEVAFDYATGTGVTKDDAQATSWAKDPAKAGNAEGEYVLGLEYLGQGSTASVGRQWMELSAKQGFTEAVAMMQRLQSADAAAANPAPTADEASGGATYTPPYNPSGDDSTTELMQMQQQQNDEAEQQRQQEIQQDDDERMEQQQQQEMQQYNAENGVNN